MAVYDLPPYQPTPSLLTGMQHKIPRNPTLPQTPLGAYTDAQFEANDAALRSAYLRKYADLMQQIGYVDANGNVIKGDIESAADAQRAEATRNMFLAKVDTINQAQNEGNYFSGYQVVRQARAEYPYANEIAGLDVSVPKAISSAQEGVAQALQDYIIQRNQELAAAAQRAADNARNNPGGGGGGGGGGNGDPHNVGGAGNKPPGGVGWGPNPTTPNPNLGGLGDNPPNPIQIGPGNFPGAPAPPPIGGGGSHGLNAYVPPPPMFQPPSYYTKSKGF